MEPRTRIFFAVLLVVIASGSSAAQTSVPVAVVGIGLDDALLGPYRQGFEEALQYYIATLNTPLATPVVARVYSTTDQYAQALRKYMSEPDAVQVARTSAGGWAGDREILIDHSQRRQPFLQYQVVAHELTHELQIELAGYDAVYSDRAWKSCWMAEGYAELVSWKVGDGRITSYARARDGALDAIRRASKFSLKQAMGTCGRFRPLQSQVGAGAAYGMSMLAAESLVDRSGHRQVVTYFRALAAQDPLLAFQSAFGITMSDFLSEFDARLDRQLGR